MRNLLILFSCLAFAVASNAATITFSAKRPAPVGINPGIKSIAIINRTVPTNKKKSKLEGVLTGEGLEDGNEGIQAALNGLAQHLRNSSRFEVIRTSEQLQGSRTGESFPDALSWDVVERLCKKHNVDAILVLETYDYDYIITNGRVDGQALRFFASGLAKVDLGIRMYDPTEKAIEDQYSFSFSQRFQSSNGTIEEAIIGLANRKHAIKDVSHTAGKKYAFRITPSWYKISREYFKKSKGDENLAMGARLMESNDWDAAIVALKKAASSGHRKTKGRAAHNLAVVYEILGKLQESKAWATTAWGAHRHKPSKDYGYWITKRINQQRVADQQLGMK